MANTSISSDDGHRPRLEERRSADDRDELKMALQAAEGGRRWLERLLWLLGVISLLALGLFLRFKNEPLPAQRYITTLSSVGYVAEKVQATGAVQPVLQVNVGAQVNGRVTRVNVDFNSPVKKGDVLAEIDSSTYGAQVSQFEAQLAAQKAQAQSSASNADTAKITWERTKKLYEQNLASKSELDTSRGQYDMARAQADAAKAQLGSISAQLSQSKTNRGFTKIISPVDGIVVTRSIDPGATVQASFQSPTLFVIAQDLKKMRVLADIDEADVGRLKEGMDAEATVDAFSGEVFKGKVQQVRYSPTTVSGVVTYAAVVDIDNLEEKLRPGMTATVTVRTKEMKDAVTIPNAALRFNPASKNQGKETARTSFSPEKKMTGLQKGKGRVYTLKSDDPKKDELEEKIVDVLVTDGIVMAVKGLAEGVKVVVEENDAEGDKDKKSASQNSTRRPPGGRGF